MMKSFINIFLCALIALSFGTANAREVVNISENSAEYKKAAVESVKVPIIMYHSVCNTNIGKYVVSPVTLENDLKYVLGQGFTPIFVSELTAFTQKKGTLPSNPIIFTFDDGFYNNFSLVFPIMKKHNAKFVVSVVGQFILRDEKETKKSDSYSYLNFQNIAQMQKSGLVEFGNHTYSMHSLTGRKGIRKLSGESEQTYKEILTKDTIANENLLKKSGVKFNLYAYPYGMYNKYSLEVLSSLGYKAFLTCNEGISLVKRGDSDSLLYLKRYNRPCGSSSQYFFTKVLNLNKAVNE